MPERLVGRDGAAPPLLQLLDVGEPPLRLARPHRIAVDAYLEHAALARPQRHLADLLFEGGQQLLRHPGGAQQPAALRAVLDLDARSVRHYRRSASTPSAPCRNGEYSANARISAATARRSRSRKSSTAAAKAGSRIQWALQVGAGR